MTAVLTEGKSSYNTDVTNQYGISAFQSCREAFLSMATEL
jgi:hypothetical protein